MADQADSGTAAAGQNHDELLDELAVLRHRVRDLEQRLLDSAEARSDTGAIVGTKADFDPEAAEWARVQAALRESERRLAKAQQQAKIAYWQWALGDEGMTYVSEQYWEILGLTGDQTLRRQKDFNRMIHPADRDRVAAYFREVSSEPRDYEVDYRIMRPGGEVRHVVEIGEVSHDERGRPAGHTGTLQDITTLKQAEEALGVSNARLRAIIENSPADIHLNDAEGRYILVNRQFEEWYGVSLDEVRGQMPHDIFPADYADAYLAHHQAVIETGQAVEMEDRAPREDGVHSFLTVRFPVPGVSSEDLIVGTVSTDITELKRRETALIEAKQEAELANRAKSEFLANMSHELRTPLNAVIGFAELIERETFGPIENHRYCDHAGEIVTAGRELLRLINDVLDLARIEAGKLQLNESEIDLGAALGASLVLVSGRARQGGLTLEPDLAEDLPRVWADAHMLKQMLNSLLSNAIKFTPAGGRIRVTTRAEGDKGYLIEISDTGVGMSLEDIPKAMVRFGQVDGAQSRKFGGSGLGLPLTKSLIELHGGSLDLESEAGAGTKVTLRLPAARILTAAGTKMDAKAAPV